MGEQKTLLIIDDEPFVLSAATKLLQGAGFIVYTCELWARVAAMVRRVQPDLILLDYNMPSIKGDVLCRLLKENSFNPQMKVVLFSAEEKEFLQKTAEECGADGFIQKDIPPQRLVKEIGFLLQEDHMDLGKSGPLEEPIKLTRVLLIDDSDLFRRICKGIIVKKYTCQIVEARNGLEGIQKLSQFADIDLVLLDINMPVMNGIQFLETVKGDRDLRPIPIIVCTTENKETDILRGLGLGAKGYITKPFTRIALCSIIDSILKKRSIQP